MKHEYISRHPSSGRLIILFSGWSTDPGFYRNLHVPGWDIAVIYDYSDFSLDCSFACGYTSVCVIAWSLGVAAAEFSASQFAKANIRIASAFAVNGTILPVSDLFGIPSRIYSATEQTLNPRNLMKFRKRMSSRGDIYRLQEEFVASSSADSDIERLKNELRSFKAYCESNTEANVTAAVSEVNLPWRRVYIGNNDLIFPAANQTEAWSRMAPEAQIVKVNTGHFFPLERIISDVIPDTGRIAGHFSRAADTYERNAEAQKIIADRLASLIDNETHADIDLLEIGAGSGLLTRNMAKRVYLRYATFVDLYPLTPFGVAEKEKYITADAEPWLEDCTPESFDLIASASTIQWFADLERFFANAARSLRPGGMLLCSTFIPGHFSELEALRPSPLILKSEREIRNMLTPYFTDIHIEEAPVILTFPDVTSLMAHLRETGINGTSTPGADIPRTRLRDYFATLPPNPTLTYRPLYIRAYKSIDTLKRENRVN